MKQPSKGRRLGLTTSVAALALVLMSAGAVSAQQRQPQDTLTPYTRDLTKELANKTRGTFVVAAVGDLLFQAPFGKIMDPALANILRSADITVGNKEGYVIDDRDWQYGHGNNWAPKELAEDLADLGFDFLGTGEGDGGPKGIESSQYWYGKVGIQIAGQGPNLTTSRMGVYKQTPKGRVGAVAAFPVPNAGPNVDAPIAEDRNGDFGTDVWGLNPLRITRWNVLTPEMLQRFKAMKEQILARRFEPDVARPMQMPPDPPDRVTFFGGGHYIAGPNVGDYVHEMNPQDLEAQILAVRDAKEYADFVIFTMHVHQQRGAHIAYSQDHYPVDYLIELNHKLIDNGMDMYVGHGNHTIASIEIYKGRPIFYNLGNFGAQRFGAEYSAPRPDGVTNIEWEEGNSTGPYNQTINRVAIIAQSTYQDGLLREVRIYPVDLGVDKSKRSLSRMSNPMTPSPELANWILTEVQKYSEPFGTKISIENGVGVIRVPPEATVPIGGDVRRTFREGGRD